MTRTPARLPVVLGLGVLVALLLVMTVAALPGVRSRPGVIPALDDWVQSAAYAVAAALVVWRAMSVPHHRLQWALIGLALTLRAAGFLHLFFVSGRAPAYPSLADAFWVLGATGLLGGLVVATVRYAPHLSRTLLLDAALGAATSAAAALVLLRGTLDRLTVPGAPADVVVTNLSYPIVDVALIVVAATLVGATHGRLSTGTITLGAGIVCFAVLDAVFLYQVTLGTFRPGSLLTPLSLFGTVLVAFASWLPQRDKEGVGATAPAGLLLPAWLAVLCVVIGSYDALGNTSAVVIMLCAGGVTLAIVRAYLTLRVDRSTASTAIAEKDDEVVRFQALVEASDDFIAIADLDGRVSYMNPAGRRLVGVADDDDVSRTRVGDFVPSLRDQTIAEGRPGLTEGGSWRGASELTDLRGGLNIPVIANSFQLRDKETGEPWLVATVQRDVTDLRAAEADLLRFRALVEASSDFIALAGMDGSVAYLNPAGRQMVGLPRDVDVTTTTIADYLTEEGLQASLEVEQPAVVGHGEWQGESTLRDLEGGPPTPVTINSFLIGHPETGEPWLLATVQRDITERRAAERAAQELADTRQELLGHLIDAQEAERARIAADVHDDSVQALASVDLRLGLLKRRAADDDELLTTIEELQREVGHATARLRHLLFDLDSPAQRDDLGTALREAAATIFAVGPRWAVQVESEVDLPETQRVIAYRLAKEAMANVSKHAQASAVEILVRPLDTGVEVAVSDNGIGFDPDAVSIRPGHRGIPDMRDRAASAGGRVSIEQSASGGTTLRIWLPSARAT